MFKDITLAQVLSGVFVVLVMAGAFTDAIYSILHGLPIPQEVVTIFSVGVGYAINALGVSHGASIIQKNTASTV